MSRYLRTVGMAGFLVILLAFTAPSTQGTMSPEGDITFSVTVISDKPFEPGDVVEIEFKIDQEGEMWYDGYGEIRLELVFTRGLPRGGNAWPVVNTYNDGGNWIPPSDSDGPKWVWKEGDIDFPHHPRIKLRVPENVEESTYRFPLEATYYHGPDHYSKSGAFEIPVERSSPPDTSTPTLTPTTETPTSAQTNEPGSPIVTEQTPNENAQNREKGEGDVVTVKTSHTSSPTTVDDDEDGGGGPIIVALWIGSAIAAIGGLAMIFVRREEMLNSANESKNGSQRETESYNQSQFCR